ncbi:MAG TPA: hypothetical protein DCW83_12965 [Saprospirales bacterium]|nr:hypothetical protein [Saprospirales bacterium]
MAKKIKFLLTHPIQGDCITDKVHAERIMAKNIDGGWSWIQPKAKKDGNSKSTQGETGESKEQTGSSESS